MATRVTRTVHLTHPTQGSPVILHPGDEVPAWAIGRITRPGFLADDTTGPVTVQVVPEPPRAGKGSGIQAWRDYADHLGLTFPESSTREELIDLVENYKNPAPTTPPDDPGEGSDDDTPEG